MTCSRKSSEYTWIEQVPHPPVPQALVVLLSSLQGGPGSAPQFPLSSFPSLPRVLCQALQSFPNLVEQLESAFPGRCALLGGDGRSRAVGIQDSPCPPGIHQSWAVNPCLAADLCAQKNSLPPLGGCARFGVNCFGKGPLKL